MMIIDLRCCDFVRNMDQDPNTISDNVGEMIIHHLTR